MSWRFGSGKGGRTLGAAAVLAAALVSLAGEAGADEPLPTLSVADVRVDEGAVATVTVTLSAAAADDVTVVAASADGSAVAPADYAGGSRTVTIPAGATSATVSVATRQDELDEDDETFTVVLSSPSANAAIGDAEGVVTIVDDDLPPTATIASADPDGVVEGAAATFTVSLSAPSGRRVTVSYRTVNGTAQAGSDYEARPPGSSITIEPGAVAGTISIPTIDDTEPEADETFTVALGAANPTVAIGSPNEAAVTIHDNEAQPALSVEGGQVAEGDAGTVGLDFTVKLSAKSARHVLVTASTANGTAVAPGDYQVGTARLDFAPGVTEKRFTVTVNGDVIDELPETVLVTLTDPDGAAIGVGEGVGTILDDDANSKLAVGDAAGDEPASGTAPLTFTVSLSPASERPVRVAWATADGTATAGQDYLAATGFVDFAPGETAHEVTVQIVGDTLNEDNETVLVRLAPVADGGAVIGDEEGHGTIVDKNAPPSLSVDDVTTREGEVAMFTITLAGRTARTVSVTAKTIDGTARAGSDFNGRRTVLTFTPGETSKTFAVVGIDDDVAEGVETYAVGLEDAVNATITKARGVGTIDVSDQRPAAAAPATPAPTATPAAVLVPRMILGPRTVPVGANGIARMAVRCQKASPLRCAGTIELERVTKPSLRFGRKTFAVGKGKNGYASIRLSPRALGLLRKAGALRARVIVLVKTSAAKPTRVVPGVVTLKSTVPRRAAR